MHSTSPTKRPRKFMSLALASVLAASAAVAVAPVTATAEPVGGYAPLVKKVSPAVVYIEVTEQGPAQAAMPEGFPFWQFYQQFGIPMPGQNGNGNGNGGQQQQQQQHRPVMHGVGSGFIISPTGLIVTNNHVVAGATKVKVTLEDGQTYTAKVLGTDPVTDVALIKVNSDKPLPYVQFGSSKKMEVGNDVMAVGNPFGLGGTVTTGIISAKARDIGGSTYDNFLQTDAAINKGNSGGPLFNDAGKVIGMNTAIMSPSGGSVGIGFAVPSDVIQNVVAQLEHGGKVAHGWLGIEIRRVSSDVASALGMAKPQGAMVAQVNPDSPAAKAGMKAGDIITSFDGTTIKHVNDLPRVVAMTQPNTKAKVDILRAGKKEQLTIDVGTMKTPKKA
ncbi:Do family serine endopeptidase [Solirhodobacter olei]|uniref:Do family serine endopeptidase n=1 Tax=Solirhodobacter olei TaxID=2493082 RepID=UPI000FDADC22|nr:Do family serine endopeptidase [Solirhodobacter olei]